MMKKAYWVVLFLTALAGMIHAHEFFVIPRQAKEYKAGDTILLDVLSTHYFMTGEEIETPASVNDVYVLQSGAKTSLPLTANEGRMLYETSYQLKDNSPAVLAGNRVGSYYCIFTDGRYADGKRADAAREHPQKTIARALFFAKFSKTYLNPDARDTAFKTPLGQTLEIIPLTNPAAIAKGEYAEFQVLYKGQPLSGAEVSATYDGYDNRTANRYALTDKTKSSGRVRFKISNSGVWLVRVSDVRPSPEPGVDAQELAAVVVFTVK
jgi:uncharacterized GH25 family protein